MTTASSLTSDLLEHIRQDIRAAGGWIGFDRYMALALYTPGLGYYANEGLKFGTMPVGVKGGGGDFVTAPEMTPLFGQALAKQVAQALEASGTDEVWEFGAGSGALAQHLLQALGPAVRRYSIVDLSGSLRVRQQLRLQAFEGRVQWVDALPERMRGVVVGNEVLDAMPVKLLQRLGGVWHERGVALDATDALCWADQPTALRPPLDIPGEHDFLTEVHPQAQAFVRTLADRLEQGAAFFLDYGFPEAEYYHPQRHMGTVMCHREHRSDDNPLDSPGLKDITAHVDFTQVALAAQEAGLDVLGYTSQGRFLINCGLPALMEQSSLPERSMAMRLIAEHEMGELFKVIGFGTPSVTQTAWEPLGFAAGDRTHTL